MKIKLNTITNYEGCTFKLGDEIDLPSNIAERWIDNNIAYAVKDIIKEEVKPEIKKIVKTISHKRKL